MYKSAKRCGSEHTLSYLLGSAGVREWRS